jgi:RNA polymerase sigma-70 factor (ECF subfamily)
MQNSTNVQELYRREGEALFARLYRDQRAVFIQWASKNFGCEDEDALEVFQESMLVLYQKIQTRELIEIRSSVKTYLFAVGRNLLLKQFEKRKRTKLMDELPEVAVSFIERQEELSDRQIQVQEALSMLGASCREVLHLFYYRNYAVEAIANQLNFNSEEVVRSKKYKCLKQLRKILNPQNIML